MTFKRFFKYRSRNLTSQTATEKKEVIATCMYILNFWNNFFFLIYSFFLMDFEGILKDNAITQNTKMQQKSG